MPRRARLKGSGNVGTTADAVYGALRRSILDGDLPPGHRLRSDALAHDLNVSRTPVREALRKLEAEGLVDAAPSGLVVRQLTEQDLTEIFYLREALEGMAARLAAENATRTDIDELHALVDDMGAVAAGGDTARLRELTGEFHRLIGRASRNSRLVQSLDALLDHVRQAQSSTLFLQGRPPAAVDEHRNLLRAIEKRDGDLAETLARQHRRKTLALRREMLREETRRSRVGGRPSLPARPARSRG
jgi:DNA-binding GntR family transcriptional regulator